MVTWSSFRKLLYPCTSRKIGNIYCKATVIAYFCLKLSHETCLQIRDVPDTVLPDTG